MPKSKSRKKKTPKRVLALPDPEQTETAVLNSLAAASGQRTYDHAIRECSSRCWIDSTRSANSSPRRSPHQSTWRASRGPATREVLTVSRTREVVGSTQASASSPDELRSDARLHATDACRQFWAQQARRLLAPTSTNWRRTICDEPVRGCATWRAANWTRSNSCSATFPFRRRSAISDASRSSGMP
jgi:hypothetical protein